MPIATDLTINNGAAVAKVYTLLSPSAGLGSNAEWALKEGTISSVFPRLTMQSRLSPNNARVSQVKFKIPSSYNDAVTGLTRVASAFEFNGTVTVPNDFPEAKKADAIAYLSNIFANAMVKDSLKDGIPCT